MHQNLYINIFGAANTMELPKRYDPKESEKKWQSYWEKHKVYAFDPDSTKEIFSIDTPPPTVSGKMHIGHAFSYSQNDFIARFQRMRGKNVFFPFGTDDNGIATERLMEKMHKIRATSMERTQFTKQCLETLDKMRPEFVQDWKNIGMSCDWSIFYSTINEHCMRLSQKSFLDLYKAGREYRKNAPALYCPECQTAVSQVETEDVELDSSFNDIVFKINGEDVIIATTRPELLPACVAVFYNPEDTRYKKYLGKKAKVPLFDFEVEVREDKRVDPEKGTGIVMCCTFGDQTDMEWYFAYDLELKVAIGKDGRMTESAEKYQGMKTKAARKEIIDDLKKAGLLVKERQIRHAVKVHERCKKEIEIMHSKQWFIKYLDIKEDMLDWGAKLKWHPPHMKVRYDNWIKGLQWDWLISRQRFHGIPIPAWYCGDCDEVILAREQDLPIDPTKHGPPKDKCPKCKSLNIYPEKDVLDTWATSSLTPQITVELMKGTKAYKKLFPMTLRPQAHDIITFWLFNTVVKSQLHHKANPWRDVVISGHAQDPHGKKMSKSLGNIVEPQKMLDKYCADALRFWSAGSKLGDDLPFQEKDLVTGMKFINKLWNASKFVIMNIKDYKPKKTKLTLVDEWLISSLSSIVNSATESFEKYEYFRTKQETDKFFWHTFCDYYLELVKDRIYNPDNYTKDEVQSAMYTLYTGNLTVLKLMAPIMPYITEEIYQLHYAKVEGMNSIHSSTWPKAGKVSKDAIAAGELIVYALDAARRAKTDRQLSLKAPIKRMLLKSKVKKSLFEKVKKDISAALHAESIEYEELDAGSEIDFEHIVDL